MQEPVQINPERIGYVVLGKVKGELEVLTEAFETLRQAEQAEVVFKSQGIETLVSQCYKLK